MKKKVTMICILKSGAVVEDTMKMEKNTQSVRILETLRKGIKESIGYKEPACSNITFGTLTVVVSEIAAITFKENGK